MNLTQPQLSIYQCKIKDYEFRLGEPILLGLVNMALVLENEGHRTEVDAVIKLCQSKYPCPISQHCKVSGNQRFGFVIFFPDPDPGEILHAYNKK